MGFSLWPNLFRSTMGIGCTAPSATARPEAGWGPEEPIRAGRERKLAVAQAKRRESHRLSTRARVASKPAEAGRKERSSHPKDPVSR